MSVTPKIRTIADELIPLAQRMKYMRLFRVAMCLSLVAFAWYAPDVVRTTPIELGRGVAVFLAVSFLAEGIWRLAGRRGLYLFGVMLIVDGVFLAWMAYLTGGASSALLNLILLHLVAVTLLASYKTGLKLAMWHSLLLLVVYYAQQARMPVPGIANPLELASDSFHRLVGFIGVYWVVALATATFSAINERELRRRRYDLEALAKMASSLETVTEARDIAAALLAQLMDTFGFGRGLVLGKLGNDVSVLSASGEGVVRHATLMTADVVMLQAWQSRKTALVSKVDPDANPTLATLLPEGRNLLVVPLTADGGSVGVAVLEHGTKLGSRIERRVVSMVERFSSHAALALRNASLVDQLRDMAATDGLTGVPNRRTFEAALEVEVDRAARSGTAVSLLLVDIDHFKKLNDRHGHQTGDEVLKAVALALRNQSRGFDTPARYGGEEFAVIMPGCDVNDAEASAERFRRAITRASSTIAVTASAGVATFPAHATDPKGLVQMADAALYESKGSGRNKTTLAHPMLSDDAEKLLDEASEIGDAAEQAVSEKLEDVGDWTPVDEAEAIVTGVTFPESDAVEEPPQDLAPEGDGFPEEGEATPEGTGQTGYDGRWQ